MRKAAQRSQCLQFDRGSFSQSEIQRLINEKILPSSLRYAEIFTTSALARLSNTEARFDGGASPALYPEQILSRANNKYGKVEQASQKLADAFRFGIKPSKPPVVACTTRALEPKALLWLKDQLVNETLLPVGTQMHVKIRGPLPNNLSAFVRRSCWLISTGYARHPCLKGLASLTAPFTGAFTQTHSRLGAWSIFVISS